MTLVAMMSSLENRLATFADVPDQQALHLARCGFFQADEDTIQCFHCDIRLVDWLNNDNIWIEHFFHSKGTCDHLLNTPLYPEMAPWRRRWKTFKCWCPGSLDPMELMSQGFFYTKDWKITCFFCGILYGADHSHCPYVPEKIRVQRLGAQGTVLHPDMSHWDDREKSLKDFTSCPFTRELSRCGFFYRNRTVTCFICGFEPSEWNNLDDVCVEHEEQGKGCPLAERYARPPNYFNIVKVPEMGSQSAREDSFMGWEEQENEPSYQELATCGYFCLDKLNRMVMCYACGVSLYPDEVIDPWKSHVEKAKGRCPFVNDHCTYMAWSAEDRK